MQYLEMVKQFIANFYLGTYWIGLCIAALVFAAITFILCFFRDSKPLGLPAWLSMSSGLLAILSYYEKTKDLLVTGDAEALENMTMMYRWFLMGICAVIFLNGIALFTGWLRKRHYARRR